MDIDMDENMNPDNNATTNNNHHHQQHQHQNNNHAYNGNGNSNNNGTAKFTDQNNQNTDLVRLIGQQLVNLGYQQTVDSLLEESGVGRLDHPAATRFKNHILNGEWAKANKDIDELAQFLTGNVENSAREMRLLITEQNFLEQIEDDKLTEALDCLRDDLTPNLKDFSRIQYLTKLLLCSSTEEFRTKAGWSGKGIESRKILMDKFHQYIPASIMLPPARLSTLLSQAIEFQKEHCLLHNPSFDIVHDYSDLKSDHQCKPVNFPSVTVQELTGHKDEVWFCKFSNDGLKLATCELKGKIHIWDFDPIKKKLTERCELNCTCYSVVDLSWSPNDTYLIACGSEDQPECWIWNVHTQELKNVVEKHENDNLSTCSWHTSGDMFAIASPKGNFSIYDVDGNTRNRREGVRVQCLSFLNTDPDHILAADILNRIRLYAIANMSSQKDEEDILEENHPIMSFVIDCDDKYIATNLRKQGVHLWDYKKKTLLRVFVGVVQRNFLIRSSFSYSERKYLASGSEDAKVYIYHPDRDHPLMVLEGHTKAVSCVSWNPRYPGLLASASDDGTARLWGPPLHF